MFLGEYNFIVNERELALMSLSIHCTTFDRGHFGIRCIQGL